MKFITSRERFEIVLYSEGIFGNNCIKVFPALGKARYNRQCDHLVTLGLEVIKFLTCTTQLSMKFMRLIIVQLLAIFISR